MDKYSEPEMFQAFNRLIRIYLESYPDDKEALTRFMQWSHIVYGYQLKDTNELARR
jgi:hypothetical protein